MNGKSRLALITGAAGNIGSTVAKKFKDAGWKVAGIDIKPEDAELKNCVDLYINCDVTDREKLKIAVKEIESSLGEIDVLFTAAGDSIEGFENVQVERWQQLLNVWLKGTINACAAVAPSMVERKYGRIVALSPDYAWTESGHIMDAAASSTLHGFVKSFGVELAQDNVLINALFANVPFDEEGIASVVLYLAEGGDYITAQVISLKGKKSEWGGGLNDTRYH